MRLADLATVVRSKNAGPFVLTFDILLEDVAAYYPFACAVKFSMMRPRASGSRYDTDVYGAQQYAPLLDLALSLDPPEASA